MKPGNKTIAIVLLFVGLVLINYLAASLPFRVDATADSIYSLSPGTKAILGKIEEPITVELYYSKDATGLPPSYKNYADRVAEMLRQYKRASHGKLVVKTVNTRPDTPEEEKATAAGLTAQVAQTGGEQFFFGLVVTQADQEKTIPAFVPSREPFLEYDLSKVIYSVQQFDKRKLGLLSSLPLQGSNPQDMQMMMMMRRQPQPSQMVVTELEDSFKIVKVEDSATELPADLDALAVIHPENISPKLQYAIDQFILSGKPVLLAVDPASQYFKQQGGQQAMMGGAQPNVSSDLPTLLNAYGIAYDPQKVVGDLENGTELRTGQNQIARYDTWISLRKGNFNAKALATAQLNSLLFVEAGSISQKSGSSLSFTPLVETSPRSGEIASMMLQFAQAEDISKQITASGKKTIAALITGKFKSAFPDGTPKDEPKPDDKKDDAAKKDDKKPAAPAESLKESKSSSTLLVVADTDWLFDDYSVQKYNVFGQVAAQPLNDNLAFATNTIEYLGGSPDLISIRGKGTSIRRFEVVQKMQTEAQAQYQEKLTALDASLQEVQKKLSTLQGQKNEGNRLIASPEVAKSIAEYQKQSAVMQSQRRQIKRALTDNINHLEYTLLVINLLASPVLLGAFGIWYYRSRK